MFGYPFQNGFQDAGFNFMNNNMPPMAAFSPFPFNPGFNEFNHGFGPSQPNSGYDANHNEGFESQDAVDDQGNSPDDDEDDGQDASEGPPIVNANSSKEMPGLSMNSQATNPTSHQSAQVADRAMALRERLMAMRPMSAKAASRESPKPFQSAENRARSELVDTLITEERAAADERAQSQPIRGVSVALRKRHNGGENEASVVDADAADQPRTTKPDDLVGGNAATKSSPEARTGNANNHTERPKSSTQSLDAPGASSRNSEATAHNPPKNHIPPSVTAKTDQAEEHGETHNNAQVQTQTQQVQASGTAPTAAPRSEAQRTHAAAAFGGSSLTEPSGYQQIPKHQAASYSKHFEDLDEWLEITGYHDREYRKRILRNHSELEGLNKRKAELEAEMQQNGGFLGTKLVKTQGNLNMPKSPTATALPTSLNHSSAPSSAVQATSGAAKSTPPTPVASKRPLLHGDSQSNRDSNDNKRLRRSPPPPLRRLETGDFRRLPSDDLFSAHRDRRQSRVTVRPANDSRPAQPTSARQHAARYFIIKSWNYDNVIMSQRDGTWATQIRNEEKLVEAFNTCRKVILCFSVNKSVAFQGYAQMESLPSDKVPEPGWVKDLKWPCSKPFYVRWITVGETHYSHLGALRNSYNEGKEIFVGRDGQEIEEVAGAELCRLMAETQKK